MCLDAPQRRLLLEMLVSERAGEWALFVGHRFGRDTVADALCGLKLCRRVDPEHAVISRLGRQVAQHLASRLVGARSRVGVH